jgi:hypothetical protein
METPECSICLSTRNKADYLELSLQSIYVQKPPFRFEVIVVDDGSTDHTENVCSQYPVRYYSLDNPRYRNPSKPRNVAFKAARGKIIIAQSDDIVHVASDAIQYLVENLQPGTFLLGRTHNYTYRNGRPFQFRMEYCGPNWEKPYFFLGAVLREHVCQIGGYDEEFVEPCFDDNWFADCLINGAGLTPQYTDRVLAHHQSHGYEQGSHDKEKVSAALYERKAKEATRTGCWISSGGPWSTIPEEPVAQPKEKRQAVFSGIPLPREPSANDDEGKIPRCMNFFWTGLRLSWMRYMTLYSFRRYHRDWRIVLHCMPARLAGQKSWASSEQQDCQVYKGPDYFGHLDRIDVEVETWIGGDEVPERLAPSHACDLCQWEILSTNGGWYSDLDVLYLRPLPYKRTCQADAVFCLTDSWMAIGLMAAAPNTRLFGAIRESAIGNYSREKYQSTGAEAVYRLAGTWPDWGAILKVGVKALNILRRRYPDSMILDLPQVTVYPWNYLQLSNIFESSEEVSGGCCGIHWFGGSNLGQEWNNLLTDENFRAHSNTYTKYAAEVLSL